MATRKKLSALKRKIKACVAAADSRGEVAACVREAGKAAKKSRKKGKKSGGRKKKTRKGKRR